MKNIQFLKQIKRQRTACFGILLIAESLLRKWLLFSLKIGYLTTVCVRAPKPVKKLFGKIGSKYGIISKLM